MSKGRSHAKLSNTSSGLIDLSNDLGIQLLGQNGYSCSLEDPCSQAIDCESCGSRTAIAFGQFPDFVYPSNWGYIALQAFATFNRQLANNYQALQGATIDATLEAFNIGDFYPHSDAQFGLRNVLAGLSTTLALLSAGIPLFFEEAEAATAIISSSGTTLSITGTYIANSLGASQDPLAVQKTYAPIVMEIYNSLVRQLNEYGDSLFAGNTINGPPTNITRRTNITILDVMANGTWLRPLNQVNVTALEEGLRIDIFSRSIDSLWKAPSSNKMWVTFTPLEGDWNATCQNDSTGPPDMKYCQVS